MEIFVSALSKAFGHTVATVPVIADRAYVRELLQLAVADDMLGPAGGPHELIVDMSERDRYLLPGSWLRAKRLGVASRVWRDQQFLTSWRCGGNGLLRVHKDFVRLLEG
ncbi:MAG: hypothetical protein N2441_06465 [Rhodocyclaceae bacterium]|nr:hypothetical protein [Rhodocyclaceae bacterium]